MQFRVVTTKANKSFPFTISGPDLRLTPFSSFLKMTQTRPVFSRQTLLLTVVTTYILFGPLAASLWAQRPGTGPPAVRAAVVGTLETGQPKFYPGRVTAKETVYIVPRVSGYLEKVAFEEGALVKKGDLLFEIEDTVYEISVRVAESIVRQIEAEIDLAKRDLERTTTLHDRNVATDQEMDQARRTIALQEARRDEAKASLDQTKNDLSYTKIYSPLTGRIGSKEFSEGNYLTPNSGVLATVVQFDPIRIEFKATERDFLEFFQSVYMPSVEGEEKKGARIEILRVDGKPYKGEFKIEFGENLVDYRTNTVTVYLICSNEKNDFYPGGYARISLAEKFAEPLPAVSVTAIMTDGIKDYVYVVGADNKAVRRDVVKGPQVFDQQVVTSGLKPGERVVVGGLNKVIPNEEVRIVETTAAPSEPAAEKKPENAAPAGPAVPAAAPSTTPAAASPAAPAAGSQTEK